MSGALKVLIIEDVEDHALLLVRELQKAGLEPVYERVETAPELERALDSGHWDAIISDFNLPALDGFGALGIVQARGLDLPFILVSGAIGEEKAAEIMKAGAQAYIRKGNYARLVPTLERELREAQVRRERRLSAEALSKHRHELEQRLGQAAKELAEVKGQLQGELGKREALERELQRCRESFRTLEERVKEEGK